MKSTPQRDDAERRLNEVRERGGVFVEAVRITRMPMVVTDPTLPGNPIIFANEAFERLSGYSAGEAMGQQPHFMSGPDTSQETLARFATAIAEGHDEDLEMLLYRKDRSAMRVAVFASPLRNEAGAVVHHFLSYLDITRRAEAELQLQEFAAGLEAKVAARTAELEAANEALRELVAERDTLLIEVNHRAKNSLAIASSVLGVQAGRQPDAAAKNALIVAQQRLGAMARLHDILSATETVQRVALRTYCDELWSVLEKATDPGERITVRYEIPADLSLDAATAVPVGLIFVELMMNAVKYAFPGGRQGTVAVRACRQGDAVTLVIRDDGIGLSGSERESTGTGIVRALIQQIGGTVTITSESGTGQPGVCATLVFPLNAAASA